MLLPKPLDSIDSWLEQFINPQVTGVNVSAKQATSFSSSGFEISLAPDINKKFKAEKENITVGLLPDTLIAQIAQHPEYKIWVPEIESFEKEITPEEFLVFETNNPAIGEEKYPTVKYFKYPGQNLVLFFKPFNLEFAPEICKHYNIVSQFLFYKAKFQQKVSYISMNSLEQKTMREWEDRYALFLISVLFQLQVQKEEKVSKKKEKKQEIEHEN